jgi:GDSL-like Lipase/Acylhydrolase family
MNIDRKFQTIRKSKVSTEKIRVLAFGSSNTERFMPGMHWFDCFELAIKHKYGRIHHCINSGISGETSSDLLNRFETDAAFYQPDMVFITIGGNDANPDKKIDATLFEDNLYKLYHKFNELGCFVIFQTYYSPIAEEAGEARFNSFCHYMNIVREVAAKTDSGLIDHLSQWEGLSRNMPVKHRELMRDAWHVNPLGNLVLGLYISSYFKVHLAKIEAPFFEQAQAYLQLMEQYK